MVEHVLAHVGQDDAFRRQLVPVIDERLEVQVMGHRARVGKAFRDEEIGLPGDLDQGLGPAGIT